MTQSGLIEALVRITAVFAVGLVLSRMSGRDCSAKRLLWAVCFASPLLVLLPLSKLRIPILEGGGTYSSFVARVYELDPGFQTLRPVYLGDPGPGPFVLLVAGLAAAGLLVLAWRLVATLQIVRAAQQVSDEELISLVYELGQHHEVSDVPIIKESDAIQSPCIWGVTQPVILVPTSMKLGLDQWRLVLEHELVHLRHRDPLRLVAYSLIQHALWWNPLVWLGFREALLANEQFVDRKLADRQGYARLLASTVVATPQPMLSRLFGHGHLLTRIRTLTQGTGGAPSGWRFAVIAAFVPAVPFQFVAAYEPDARKIGNDEVVFVSRIDDRSKLWRMASDGRNPTPLPDTFIDVGVPRVSPDGKWLAYNRSPEGQEDIYIARVDGTGERRVVATPARDVQPVWSPDGSKLVFCTMATGNWEIGLADLQGDSWRFVTRDGKRNLEPSWHPSGERIVFSSHRTGSQKLWSMNLDGSELVQLTFGSWEDTHGLYSADGRLLIYASLRRSRYESTLLDLKTAWVQPLVPLHQLDTGEVDFTDADSAVVMTSQDGSQTHIAKVELRDMEFTVLTQGWPSLWPATR